MDMKTKRPSSQPMAKKRLKIKNDKQLHFLRKDINELIISIQTLVQEIKPLSRDH